jgi:hypothetical protein
VSQGPWNCKKLSTFHIRLTYGFELFPNPDRTEADSVLESKSRWPVQQHRSSHLATVQSFACLRAEATWMLTRSWLNCFLSIFPAGVIGTLLLSQHRDILIGSPECSEFRNASGLHVAPKLSVATTSNFLAAVSSPRALGAQRIRPP